MSSAWYMAANQRQTVRSVTLRAVARSRTCWVVSPRIVKEVYRNGQ